jgi:penicillin-binding protein 1B
MSEAPQNVLEKIFGIGGNKQPESTEPQPPATPEAPETEPKKKNILEKIFGGGDNKQTQPTPPQPASPSQ